MATTTRGVLAGIAALASISAFAPAAMAGCGVDAVKQPASFQVTPSDYQPNAAPAIVGMWSVTFVAGGDTIDFGYQVWHSDFTEFTNSGGRAPSTQNFCLGVWAQTGPFSFKLNHFALSYSPSGVLNGRVNIKEQVVVDPRGATFAGPFTIDVYNPKTGALLQHVGGRIVGKRVTVD